MAKKILLAVGGTGGHLFPAQSLAEQLQHLDCELLFVGSKLKMNPYFKSDRFLFKEIEACTFSLKDGFKIFQKSALIFKGVYQSLKILKHYEPDIIIGFGSFHSLPLLIAATFTKRSYYLHEQNIQLGRVNKLFARFSSGLLTHYSKTEPHYPNKMKRVRMPLKFWNVSLPSQKEAKEQLGLSLETKTLLVFGGSQGSLFLNTIFLEALSHLREHSFQVIHLTGVHQDLSHIKKTYREWGILAYVSSYEERMEHILKAADFILSRSGASTLAEQIELEIPSILVPYPHASNHQEVNADYMEQVVKGGIKLLEKDLNASVLAKQIQHFLKEPIRQDYIRGIQLYKKQVQAQNFADLIHERYDENN